eukprot:761282-Hanusia_phi.AAC.3
MKDPTSYSPPAPPPPLHAKVPCCKMIFHNCCHPHPPSPPALPTVSTARRVPKCRSGHGSGRRRPVSSARRHPLDVTAGEPIGSGRRTGGPGPPPGRGG